MTVAQAMYLLSGLPPEAKLGVPVEHEHFDIATGKVIGGSVSVYEVTDIREISMASGEVSVKVVFNVQSKPVVEG